MENNPLHISIVIIGYNTKDSLKKTLESINNLIITNHIIEIIYIDDGSTDNSFKIFTNFNLKFNKNQFQFNNNQGRSHARSKGIELASGEWVVFLNSNIRVESNLILKYSESIWKNTAYAFGGCINYTSTDSIFEKYLNHPSRGIKKYTNYQIIDYQNLLFSNCMIKKSIFDTIKLNLDLKYYGAEELDFAYQLNKKFPKMMRASKEAIATRINHPDYEQYLYKLIEFGATNFNYLDEQLKRDVIRFNILLMKNICFRGLFNLLYCICRRYYKIKFISNDIIKIGMLSAILKGYYKIK